MLNLENKSSSPLTILITGASYGIGADLARICAQHGHHLVLVARSQDKLDSLAQDITQKGAPAPLVISADLTQKSSIDVIEMHLRQHNIHIHALINNAGYGLTGASDDVDQHDQLGIIDLNIHSLVSLTLRLMPDLKAAHGRILNVGSIAGFMPGPYMAVYYASKAFVLSFSQALRAELAPHHVKVSTLCPGLTATEFQRRAGMDPSLGHFITMSSEEVAKYAYAQWMSNTSIIIPGLINKIFVWLAWLLPTSILVKAMQLIQINRRAKQPHEQA